MAESSVPGQRHALGAIRATPPALSLAEAADHPWLCVANPYPEEPYALIALVRFCGGFGRATSHFYPEGAKGWGSLLSDRERRSDKRQLRRSHDHDAVSPRHSIPFSARNALIWPLPPMIRLISWLISALRMTFLKTSIPFLMRSWGDVIPSLS